MKVLKFGGTSVGSVERIKEVAALVTTPGRKIVVLSAMAVTTNRLVDITNYLYWKNYDGANEEINTLERDYQEVASALFRSEDFKQKGLALIASHFDYVRSFTRDIFTVFEEKAILAQGELVTTALFNFYLHELGFNSRLLPALDFMRTNKNQEPNTIYIRENLNRLLDKTPDMELFITQGYICRNSFGEVDNLKRGGSDYSASLIAAAVEANELQIWTDINGMHDNDPRFVEATHSLAEVSYDEAAELAYFGAKILHPTSMLPAKLADIPVRVLSTINPEASGTLISSKQTPNRITAVAAKGDITAIKIKSGRMLLAYGFLRKVFEIFEYYQTPIDMITTSEVAVSVTIDNDRYLEEITNDLRKFSNVEVDSDQVIICIVGDLIAQNTGYANRIFSALKNIPIRMISYGGSEHNITILVSSGDKKKALNMLSNNLF